MTDTTTSSPADRPVIKLRSPADLLEVVPYTFGFHPRESVVVAALGGDRNRIGVQLRLDLEAAIADPGFPERVAMLLRRERARSAIVIVYTEAAHGPDELPGWPLVAALRDAIEDAGVELKDGLCVGAGRWWSYLCSDPECCPPEGTELATPGSSRVAAEATFAGLTALPDRAALAETLRPVGFLARRGMEQKLCRADDELVEEAVAAGRRSVEAVEELRAGRVRELRTAVDRAGAGEWLPDDEVARLVVALTDIAVRDACCEWVGGDLGDAALALWVQLARRTVLDFDVTPMFLVAWTAWRGGNGTLAQIALERTLAVDPEYSFALVLDEALLRGVNPAEMSRSERRRAGERGRRRGSRRS